MSEFGHEPARAGSPGLRLRRIGWNSSVRPLNRGGRRTRKASQMRRIAAATGTLLLAGTAAAILSAGTASAATAGTPILLGSFHLTKTDSSGAVVTADLNCVKGRNVYGQTYITGNGTVTDPTEACQELADVDGDF